MQDKWFLDDFVLEEFGPDLLGGEVSVDPCDNVRHVVGLEPGPVEYTPPSDDPQFEKFEPNSGIYLS